MKDAFTVEDYEYIPSLNALKFVLVDTKLQKSCSLLLLYRKNNSNVKQYLETLKYVLNSCRIDVVFGDFNINYFNDTQCQPLMSLMESFHHIQIVTEPTLISSGSLLDHVYITPTIVDKTC